MHPQPRNSSPSRPSGRQETQTGQETNSANASDAKAGTVADARRQDADLEEPHAVATTVNITEQEIEKLKSTKSEAEWNAVCDQIKRARGRQYPPDWWPRMMMTGLIDQIQQSWSKV